MLDMVYFLWCTNARRIAVQVYRFVSLVKYTIAPLLHESRCLSLQYKNAESTPVLWYASQDFRTCAQAVLFGVVDVYGHGCMFHVFWMVTSWHGNASQRAHGAIITSLWRPNDVATSFGRHNDVIIASCARWVSTLLAMCEWYPLVTDGFPSQTISNTQAW